MPFNLTDPSEEEQQNIDVLGQTRKLTQEQIDTAERKERPRGAITEAGEWVDENLSIMNMLDKGLEFLDDVTEGTLANKIIKPISEVIPDDQGLREVTANIPVIGQPMTALDYGVYQGAMTASGLTPLARLANQEATWDNRPNILKEGFLNDTIYETAKVVTPTLIWKKAGLPLTGTVKLNAIESMIEAVGQDSADDLIAGRYLAGLYGNLYGQYTGSPEEGAKLTKALIEGDSAAASIFLGVWGTMNNVLINSWTESAFKFLRRGGSALKRNIANSTGSVDEIAKMTGKTPDEVVEGLSDVRTPEYRTDVEPGDSLTADTVNLQLKPTPEEATWNLFGFIKKLRAEQNGQKLDLYDPGNFFADWSKLVGADKELEFQLKMSFFGKESLEAGSLARQRMLRETADFIVGLGDLLDKDKKAALMQLMDQGGFRPFQDTDPRVDFAATDPKAVYLRRKESKQAAKEWDKKFLDYFEKYAEIDLNTREGLVGVAFSRYLAEQGAKNLQTLATQINTMKRAGEDTSKLIEEVFIPNQRFLRAALTPFRKAKRQFYLLGEAQQSEFNRELKELLGEAPPSAPTKKVDKTGGRLKITKDGDLLKLNIEGAGELDMDSLEMLYGMSKNGDKKATEMFELALANIQFGDPEKVISNLQLTANIVEEALKNKDAWQRYFYNVVALGQLSTQTNAAGATVFRQVMEPLALVVQGVNPLNPYIKPRDSLYGLGQLVGGLYHFKSAFKSGIRALETNAPTAGKDRFSTSYSTNLRKELQDIRAMHRYQYERMVAEGANPLEITAAFVGQKSREIAYHPEMNVAVRVLMAGDEAAKVTTAGQHAWGRAFVELWDRAEFSPNQMMEQIRLEEGKIFKGPAWRGEIIDQEVKAVADRVTLQENFKLDQDSNPIERFFIAQAEGNKYSLVQRIFNAFPRAAYRQLEQEYFENVVGSTPFAKANKKIKAIRESSDPTQRLALDAQISLAQLIGTTMGIGSVMSMYGPGSLELFGVELPRVAITSDGIIIEGEIYDEKYDFSKFSPSTVMLSIIGAANEAFLMGETSEETFGDQIGALFTGITAGIVQRNMLAGPQKFGRVVNVGSETWGQDVFSFLWDFITPGVFKEFADIIQPFETSQDVRTFPGQRILSAGAKQGFNNIQNPVMYDIYNIAPSATGKPKVATRDPFNVSQTRLGMAASLAYPGRVTPTRYFDPVMQEMTKYNFNVAPDYLRRIHTVELDASEQSRLSEYIQGRLHPALTRYVESAEHRRLKKNYRSVVEKLGAGSKEAQDARNKIYNKFNKIHYNIKRQAIIESGLYKDERIKEALEASPLLQSPQVGALSPERQGMYAQAAKQETPLAQQVRNILDIA